MHPKIANERRDASFDTLPRLEGEKRSYHTTSSKVVSHGRSTITTIVVLSMMPVPLLVSDSASIFVSVYNTISTFFHDTNNGVLNLHKYLSSEYFPSRSLLDIESTFCIVSTP